MGTSNSSNEWVRKLTKLSAELDNTRKPLTITALAGKGIFATSAAAAGASRLARARYDIRGNRAIIRYAGAKAHLVNNDTKGHPIFPRSRGRGRGRRALTFNGVLRAYVLDHPGTTGKRFFQAAKAVASRELPKVYMKAQVTDPLRRLF